MTVRGLGAIADLPEHVDDDLRFRHVGALIGAGVESLPPSVDYSALVDTIPDQGSTSSCVGQAFATVLYLRAQIAGAPIARPSAKAIYDCARLLEQPNILADTGSRPRLAIQGLQEFGMVAEERWPLTDDNVNDVPPLDVFRAGLGAMLGGYYRIGGADVATLARSALSKGFPVFFAMPVDNAFLRISDGAVYEGAREMVLGSHAMALVGYGEGWFRVANSWGASWGAGGFGRVADSVLNTIAFDLLVPTVLPRRVS